MLLTAWKSLVQRVCSARSTKRRPGDRRRSNTRVQAGEQFETRLLLAADPLVQTLADKALQFQPAGTYPIGSNYDRVEGAINRIAWPAAYPNWYFSVEPFFGHMTGLGLLEAYRHQIDNGVAPATALKYRDAVKSWLEWCTKSTQLTATERRSLSGLDEPVDKPGLTDRQLFFAMRSPDLPSPYSQPVFHAGSALTKLLN